MNHLIRIVFLLALGARVWAADASIAGINRKAADIDAAIATANYSVLEVAGEEESEGIPPRIKFYARKDKLAAMKMETGHESWLATITVYFYDSGRPMKYLRVITGREDKPEREAILYSPEGRVVWKNVPAPKVEAAAIVQTWKTLQALRAAAASY